MIGKVKFLKLGYLGLMKLKKMKILKSVNLLKEEIAKVPPTLVTPNTVHIAHLCCDRLEA